MDILIFGGQSNMQGQTESCPDRDTVDNAYEYLYKTDTLKPLSHPVGEDIGELLLAAHEGHGNLIPSFCKSYIKLTGSGVCAVAVAKGATTIDDWDESGERYKLALNKIKAAVAAVDKVYGVDRIYYVWLQGESDALRSSTAGYYLDKLIKYKNALKRDAGIETFGIIRVGYFTCDHSLDLAVMQAQEDAVKLDRDFIMLTRIAAKLSLASEYINPYAEGHYNNAAMDIIGTRAGATLAHYATGEDISLGEEDI